MSAKSITSLQKKKLNIITFDWMKKQYFNNISSYEVTIFPAESVKNVHTLPAHGKSSKNFTAKSLNEPMYHTW